MRAYVRVCTIRRASHRISPVGGPLGREPTALPVHIQSGRVQQNNAADYILTEGRREVIGHGLLTPLFNRFLRILQRTRTRITRLQLDLQHQLNQRYQYPLRNVQHPHGHVYGAGLVSSMPANRSQHTEAGLAQSILRQFAQSQFLGKGKYKKRHVWEKITV